MPEWPELRVMQVRIAEALVGRKLVGRTLRPVAEFEGGTELCYRDDVRMGTVYLGVAAPGCSDIGPDAGTFGWSGAEFAARAKAKRSEVEAAMPLELGKKPRDFMKVRRRKGLDDVDLCPRCQPAPKGQLY